MVTQLRNQQSVIVFMGWENKRREGKDSNSRDGGGVVLPPRCCYDFAEQRDSRGGQWRAKEKERS